LHITRDSPLGLYSENFVAIGFCDEIWSAARSVCWCAVLLEDESGGQPAIALKER